MSCIAAIGHWIAILLVRGRRPTKPTRLDTLVVKFGFVFLLLVVYAIALLIARIVALG